MKQKLTLLFILFAQIAFGNMASPYRQGTLSAAAFSSKDIDILKERLTVTIQNGLDSALYDVEYFIRTDTGGMQVPLLFYAMNYLGSFKVWVDGQEVSIKNVNYDLTSYRRLAHSYSGENETVISWDEHDHRIYNIYDLKFFEALLSKGEHNIRVSYVAKPWANVKPWIKEYSFRYSLTPAKYWRSFGTLEVTINAPGHIGQFTTNLGTPQKAGTDSSVAWLFQQLPAEYFEINYIPEVSTVAKLLVKVGPGGLTIIFSLLLAMLHLFFIRRHSKRNPQKKRSWVKIMGIILFPLIIRLFYMYAFTLIDNAIGKHAGRYHGYTVFVIVLYPLVMALYWLCIWLPGKITGQKTNTIVNEKFTA